MIKKVFGFFKLLAIYVVFCTVGLFFSIIFSKFLLVFMRGDELIFIDTVFWAAKKSYVAGSISAFAVLVYFYLYDFLMADKNKSGSGED